MRRALPLVVAIALIAVAGIVALTLPPPGAAGAGEPRITRLFISAIKADCRERAGIDAGTDIGYTFDAAGALTTIDHDGSFTGIDAGVLAVFNDCLAQYPIEPITDIPHDHYSRNLLYDYNIDVLEPCLSARVDELPPMPSRSDFVVRLYAWDPFRGLAADLPLGELLDLSADCPQLPAFLDPTPASTGSATGAITHALAWRAQEDCLARVGIPPEPGHSWNIVGQTVQIRDADGGVIASFDEVAAGPLAGRSLRYCLESVPYDRVASPPSALAGRLLLAEYSRHVLWPCLRGNGVDPGPEPADDAFVTLQGARETDPYAGELSESLPTDALLRLADACPPIPRYLAAG